MKYIYVGYVCLFVLDIGFKVSVSIMEKVIKLVHLEIEIFIIDNDR